MRLSPSFSRRARKVFFFIHLWTGLLLGLWFAVIGVTGSALAWVDELTAVETRVRLGIPAPPAGAEFIPLSQASQSMRQANPDLTPKQYSAMLVPTGRFPFYIAWKPIPDGMLMHVVDPYTGKAYPPVDYDRFWIFLTKDLHMRLLTAAKGLFVNGVLSFLAVFMLLSGIWLWWPSTVRQLKQRLTVKRGVSIKRTLYDLHNVLGVYLYGLLFLTTITAVVWVVDDVTEGAIVKSMDGQPAKREGGGGRERSRSEPAAGTSKTPLDMDTLMQKAAVAAPAIRIHFVMLPTAPEQPFRAIVMSTGDRLLNNGQVTLDPYTGEVKSLVWQDQDTRGKKTMALVEDLHRGTFGGVWSKTFYCLTGLMPLGLFITGIWMWFNKKRGQWKNRARRGKEKPVGRPRDEVVASTSV